MSNLPDEIPVDQYLRSYDPEYDIDGAYSAFTLASTTHDFSYENGRRYSTYRSRSTQPFPLDELSTRNERILHHTLLCILNNQLCLSRLEAPRTILDVRCAQGIWAENAAEKWEGAEVVAMDTTPRERSTIPNCTFVVQSFTDEWILDTPGMKFDFIYARNCFAATADFESLYRQCFEHLAPSGRLEHVEVEILPHCDDGSERPDSQIRKLASMTPAMSTAFGTQFNIAERMEMLIKEAGFVDVVETKFKAPLGPWSADQKYKERGIWFEAFYKSGLQGWMMAVLTRTMGYTVEHVNEMCELAFREIDERTQHFYFNIIVVTARKPA